MNEGETAVKADERRALFGLMECGHPATDLMIGPEGAWCAGCVVDSGNYSALAVLLDAQAQAEQEEMRVMGREMLDEERRQAQSVGPGGQVIRTGEDYGC